MIILLVGMLIFFEVHALSMMRGLRAGLVDKMGAGPYKIAYSVLSAIGLVLIVVGFGQYRASGYIPVWSPPAFMTHIAMLLMLPAMIALGAFLVPRARIKSLLKHPMLVSIKLWALAHLLVNGDLGSIILFGAFLVYAVVNRISVKRRGVAVAEPAAWGMGDAIAIGLGVSLFFAFVYGLHSLLIGVPVLVGR